MSLVDPYPPRSGKPVVLDGFLQYFADRLGPERVHYILVGERKPGAPEGFPVPLHQVPGPSDGARLMGLLTHGLSGHTSLQEALLRSPAVGRGVRTLLRNLRVDLEVFDTMRVAQHADPGSRARQMVYLDDLHSERYRRMLAAMHRFPDVDIQPLGTFTDQVPQRLRLLSEGRACQRALLTAEQRSARRSEDRAARRFMRCLLVNDGEAEHLRQRTGVPQERVVGVPPFVHMPGTTRRVYAGAPEFAFLGMLAQPHNEDGLRHFLTAVWPLVLRRRPDALLRVIGKPPRAPLREVIDRYPGSVVLEGYVPNLDDALAHVAALVNPLRFGTGIKIKVLEALGRGVPVVSSAVGADGIDSGPGTGVIIGDGPAATVEAMVRLVDVPTNRAESAAAAEHFTRRYSMRATFDSYDRAFGLTAATSSSLHWREFVSGENVPLQRSGSAAEVRTLADPAL